MTVSLPERGDGSRRRRRSVRRRRTWAGRARTMFVAVVAVLVVGAVGGLGWAIFDVVDDRGDDTLPTSSPTTANERADGPGPALVVLTDAGGSVYGITVFAPATATIVHVPPGALVEVPSLGLTSLGEAGRVGDLELLRHALENLLGVTFDAAVGLRPDDLAALVQPVAPLAVSPARALGPADALEYLSELAGGESLERITRHVAFWEAYMDSTGRGDEAPVLGGATAVLASLAGSDVSQEVLPVKAVADDLYQVLDEELAGLLKRVFPGVAHEDRFRVQILNGAGTPGIAQIVQPLLTAVGGRVALSGNADRFDYETTQIVYYDDVWRDAAEAIRSALGTGTIAKSAAGLDVVDVTVVVGADFVRSHPGPSPASEG